MNRREREKKILKNLELVKIIALKIARRIPPGIETSDLIHSGIIGLIDAAEKYDHEKGTRFTTYASLRIRGAILDELRNYDWASRSLRKKIKRLETKYRQLRMKLEREPTEKEIAGALKITVTEYRKLLSESRALTLGVFRYYEDSEENLSSEQKIKFLSDESRQSPFYLLEKEELTEKLASLVAGLPEKEKLVLNLYYIDDLNLKEIARVLDLSESRISQIRSQAILRLRNRIGRLARENKVDDINYIGG